MFSTEQMRDTILGRTNWIRCLACEATGIENWNEDGEDIRPGPTGNSDRDQGECESCNGLGFIIRSE